MAHEDPPAEALDVDAVPRGAFALADEWPPLRSAVHTHAKHQPRCWCADRRPIAPS